MCIDKHLINFLYALPHVHKLVRQRRVVRRYYFSLLVPRNLGKLSVRPCRSTCRQSAHATATDAKRQGREGACPSNAISCHFYFPPWLHECVHARHRGSSVKRPAIIPDIDLRYIHAGSRVVSQDVSYFSAFLPSVII